MCDPGQICFIREGSCDTDAVGVCVDEQPACPDIFAPVCGCDAKTYANRCLAAKEDVTVESEGECETSDVCSRIEDTCKVGTLCFVEPGNCAAADEGLCIEEPDVCPGILEPVCGCDRKNHVNACLAAKEGVTVEATGFCAVTDVCANALECDEGEFCLFPQGTCDESPLGKCVKEPAKCPDTDKPVCDCEGKPHTNICVALKAGAQIAKPGDCR